MQAGGAPTTAAPRKSQKEMQEEMGGAGVYSADLRKGYLLANDDWRYDIMPEILDGHNVADFIDPDIDAKLAELEREEEELEVCVVHALSHCSCVFFVRVRYVKFAVMFDRYALTYTNTASPEFGFVSYIPQALCVSDDRTVQQKADSPFTLLILQH